MKNQKNRSMKVHSQSGRNYKATPTIILKGQWLQEMGFEIGDYISVSCENGKLIITPDVEKAAMEQAEAEFMEKEMKKLQKKFKKKRNSCTHGLLQKVLQSIWLRRRNYSKYG